MLRTWRAAGHGEAGPISDPHHDHDRQPKKDPVLEPSWTGAFLFHRLALAASRAPPTLGGACSPLPLVLFDGIRDVACRTGRVRAEETEAALRRHHRPA